MGNPRQKQRLVRLTRDCFIQNLEERMIKKIIVFFISAVVLTASQIYPSVFDPAQTAETESRVPELSAFHDVIYPIWHTAYPEKDYDALRKFVPEITRLADGLYTASLPGILRDKKARWEAGLEEMKKAVDNYSRAASGEDNLTLLNAAEDLHANYEMMVRIIRPVLKEVDEFHKTLYTVYHKYLPNREFGKIGSATPDLIVKSEAIVNAKLPQRLEAKNEQFASAAQELLAAAKVLEKECKTQDPEAIQRAVDILHSRYQNLEKIFE
jgi:hypothetical protein